MQRPLGQGVELDDERSRIDVLAVHDFLSNEAYWAKGRSLEVVATLVRDATRVVGLYDGERQVGFARVVSDGVNMAFLADVYVLNGYRGRGFGVELVREAVDNGPQRHLPWWLGTLDAHGLYERFGFTAPGPQHLARPARPHPQI